MAAGTTLEPVSEVRQHVGESRPQGARSRRGPRGGGRGSPVPDQEVSVSREWHGRVLLQGHRFPEVLAQLSHHQLLHGAGDGRTLEIQKVTGVRHVQDGPRPAATEAGPGGRRRSAGRLLPPPPPPCCPGAQQSAAFRAKTHALPRLSSPALLGRAPARDSPVSLQDAPAGETPRSQLCVYVNRAPVQQAGSPSPPSRPLRRAETPPEEQRQDGPPAAAARLLPPRALPRGEAGPLPSVPPAPAPACSALPARQVCGGPEDRLREVVVVVAFSLHPASD